jgi:isopenicillin N synthase-like dioxygenase
MKTVHRLFEREEFAANHAAIEALHSEIRKDGYVYVECRPELAGVITVLTSMAKRFFELPANSKQNFIRETGHSLSGLYLCSCMGALLPQTGWTRTVSRKLEYADRAWPREFIDIFHYRRGFNDEEFEERSAAVFDAFERLCGSWLEQLFFPLQCSPVYLESLITKSPRTMLRCLKYTHVSDTPKETCKRHTDRGLLTLTPCLGYGLFIKSLSTGEWDAAEANAPQTPCFILFAGEQLATLSAGHFKAVSHTVRSNTERYSFPFFLRAHNSAVLDTYRLHSPILNRLIAVGELQYTAPVTAQELEQITDKQYKLSAIPS